MAFLNIFSIFNRNKPKEPEPEQPKLQPKVTTIEKPKQTPIVQNEIFKSSHKVTENMKDKEIKNMLPSLIRQDDFNKIKNAKTSEEREREIEEYFEREFCGDEEIIIDDSTFELNEDNVDKCADELEEKRLNDDLNDLMRRIDQTTQNKPIPLLSVNDAIKIADAYNSHEKRSPKYVLTYLHILQLSKKIQGLELDFINENSLNESVEMVVDYLNNYHMTLNIDQVNELNFSLTSF